MKSQNSPVLRFIVGCALIWFAWSLVEAGFVQKLFNLFRGNSGFAGVSDLLLDVLPYLVDTIMLFGTVAIAIWAFFLKAVTPLATKLLRLLDARLESYGVDLWDFDEEEKPVAQPEPKLELDVAELNAVLSELDESIDSLSERLAVLEGEQV